MSRIGGRDTAPEVAVRKILHSLGYRFRLYRRDLPGTPDIVFPGRRKVIFVHGCFWHGHECSKGRLPKSRLDFWLPKLEKTKARDNHNEDRLRGSGWDSLTIWQCQIGNLDLLKSNLSKFLGPPGSISIDNRAQSG